MDLFNRITRILTVLLLVLNLIPRNAAAAAVDEDFASWLAGLKAEAVSAGVPPATVEAALAGIEPQPEVVRRDRNQPEFKLDLGQYLGRIVTDERVARGRRILTEHRQLLEEVAARYGVQPRFLVAFWGIETDYGRVLGDFPVIRSLVTLAYDPRRSGYFRRELLEALLVLGDGLAPLDRMKGSWAGAMGGLQFMPSVYRRYAVDHDGDGHCDIWGNPADMFASGANYLAGSGWQNDRSWGRQVWLPEGFDPELAGHGTLLLLEEWQRLGVRRYHGRRDLPQADLQASVLVPDRNDGRAFLVYDNFRTILKWNRSDLFALAVGMLADRIGAP